MGKEAKDRSSYGVKLLSCKGVKPFILSPTTDHYLTTH